ncbi:hypothetical protein ACFQE5_07180 [Pseudonocardia hispaniensis]|uniref:DUF4190 domain-containing protein n=1 Tax=Pseudonocardia hispaniensis TaxID=904933 RepID=A0ABW1IZV0_9PSEU
MSRSAERATPARPGRVGRVLRGCSGVLAGGLVTFAMVLLAGWFFTTRTGSAGPGTGMLMGHWLAAVVAGVAQVVADRRTDRTGTIAALGVLAVTAAVLGIYWLWPPVSA